MSKVICFSYERMFHLDGILSGPGSRLWEIANALKKKGHIVTIAQLEHDKDYTKNGIDFISWDTKSLKNIETEFDVAFLPLSAYVNKYFGRIKKIPTVVDLSTPIAIEAMAHSIGIKDDFFLNEGIIPTYLALENGDYFICSNRAQKYFYLGMMSLMGINSFDDNIIEIAPLAPRIKKPVIRKKSIIKKIVGKNKKVILFMGGLYSWYDYKTPILAMKEVIKKQKDAVLVFVGALNPNIPELTKENYVNAKKLADKENLLNKSIFFMDWASSTDRWNIYEESEFAVVTSFETSESAMSYRMRIIDFLYGGLPVICTKNDELSEIIEKKNLGNVIGVNDEKDLSKKLIETLSDKILIKKYKKNIVNYISNEFNIDETIKPLDKYCRNPKITSKRSKLDFIKIIDEQKSRIKALEYIKDDKEGVNTSLVNEIKNQQIISENQRNKISELEHIKSDLSQKTNVLNQDKDNLINEIENINQHIKSIDEIKNNQNEIIKKQKFFIGKFKNSVVYPLYRMTHNLGKTKIGQIMQKLLK
ncbi:glycosyltransferase [archaeon]|jgi:glycosyltransferase involved in cell wall biosynthesis|nr:glycosyltransferase [Candidatus Woesearchaeota archaeon]MBT3464088.1 glycosyltransferase [archaeon]MBT4351689.1 glycosyltransferase [archaeon]MBT4647511.1 glycosyltransferase [archaeon]MBT6821992.1 glycosyltransferase [archaeon]